MKSLVTELDPKIAITNSAEPEVYDRFIDRFFIRVGEITTRYFGVIVGLILFGLLGLGMIAGSVLVVRSVGQRINDMEVREQERLIFAEQQIQQTTNQSDRLATKRQKTVDESSWFVVLEDGEELPSAQTAEDDELIQADATQQFVQPSLPSPNDDILTLDDIRELKASDEAVSN